jgi:hypothetical protein
MWEPASLFVVSGVPGASSVGRGRARGASDKKRLWGTRLETYFCPGALQVPLGDALGKFNGIILYNSNKVVILKLIHIEYLCVSTKYFDMIF